jgi:uncharacterized protein
VFSSADRLRRVLADGALPAGAPPLVRASQVPPPSPEKQARREALRQRLASLRVAAPQGPAAPEGGVHGAAPDESGAGGGRTLEELVQGRERQTAAGAFLAVERRYPLEALHGRVVLAEALVHPLRLRAKERGPDQRRTLDLKRAVFLDTETTGLAGGTGTVAFLVGTGTLEDDAFVVRQYALRDYPEERALLGALAEDLADRPLVSFNGRAFDWPLLTTRFALHRLRMAERAHLDLLPAARRIWSGSLPSHSLAMLERHVLGLERADDLPGSEIPAAFFRYVRTGEAATIARAFRHNELDVVSMLALVARVGAVLGGATAALTGSPRDHLGTARLLLEHGDEQNALRCLEAGLARAGPEHARELLHLKARVARGGGRPADALATWRAALALPGTPDLVAHVEAAKLLEHRLARPAEALALTEAALAVVSAGSPEHRDLEHRARRLRRLLAR